MFENCTFGVLLATKFLLFIHNGLIEVSAGVKLEGCGKICCIVGWKIEVY